jgi:membrane protease YdiL (CAAX protease family)
MSTEPARSWPPGRQLAAEESVPAACGACGTAWRVHLSLAGFRMRCSCGAWVDVPRSENAPAQLTTSAAAPYVPVASSEPGAYALGPALSSAAEPGALADAHPRARAAWTDRTLLEAVALLFAILGPQLLAYYFARGREQALLVPFASLLSSLFVILIAASSGAYGRASFRTAAPRHWLEALGVAPLLLGFAFFWLWTLHTLMPERFHEERFEELTTTLGMPWTLFVIAVVPAFVEEIAFRGMLQGRLNALLGLRSGMLLTALSFALCHFSPAVLPIHFGLGLYLGWLRQRSGSILPGMLLHCAYNSLVLLVA